MGVLKAWNGTAWEAVSGVTTNEVFAGDTDPRSSGYTNAMLWIDLSVVPEVVRFWNGNLGKSGDRAAGWDVIGGNDLPLAGGTMNAGAKIGFASEVGDKINLYGTTFGIGIEGGQTVLWRPDGNKVSFRKGGARTGTEVAFIDDNGLGPRTNNNVVGRTALPARPSSGSTRRWSRSHCGTSPTAWNCSPSTR